MCGILAIFSDKRPSQLNIIERAVKHLSRRGPDSSKTIEFYGGLFSFQRLAVIDTSSKAAQPFVYRKRRILMMCNGEIYNHEYLRKKFNLKCESNNDCEVILALYKKFGIVKTMKSIIGVFAFVLIEGDQIFIARDRMGIRPLFMGFTEDGTLVVSSLATVISKYLFMLSAVAVQPGVVWKCIKGNTYLTPVYDYHLNPKAPNGNLTFDICTSGIRQSLTNSLTKRLMSDRPLGCLLSGGVDSSIIAALLVEALGADKVRTYSIGMEGSTDLGYAQIMADHLGTAHTTVIFTPEEGFSAIPDVIEDIESYDTTTVRASIPMWLLAKYISEHTTDIVIMSGEGADELFMGYLYFHNAPTLKAANAESLRLLNELSL